MLGHSARVDLRRLLFAAARMARPARIASRKHKMAMPGARMPWSQPSGWRYSITYFRPAGDVIVTAIGIPTRDPPA